MRLMLGVSAVRLRSQHHQIVTKGLHTRCGPLPDQQAIDESVPMRNLLLMPTHGRHESPAHKGEIFPLGCSDGCNSEVEFESIREMLV